MAHGSLKLSGSVCIACPAGLNLLGLGRNEAIETHQLEPKLLKNTWWCSHFYAFSAKETDSIRLSGHLPQRVVGQTPAPAFLEHLWYMVPQYSISAIAVFALPVTSVFKYYSLTTSVRDAESMALLNWRNHSCHWRGSPLFWDSFHSGRWSFLDTANNCEKSWTVRFAGELEQLDP